MKVADIQLWTALITPMRENGEIDADELALLIQRQDAAGNGVLILGSTGEGLALDAGEKKKVVETATGLSIDVPLMIGVGGFNLKEQIEWIEYCKEFEVDSFLLVTPLYAKPGVEGQIHWFKSLLDVADAPCMLYNIPSRSGIRLHPKVLTNLLGHPNLYALKEASGSIADYQQYRQTVPDLAIFSGDDGLTPYFAMAGCDGLVSVASNVWPEETHRYVELCLKGKGADLFPLWKEATDALFVASNPIPAKILLKEKGVIKTATLRPPLSTEDLKDNSWLLMADKAVGEWYKTYK